METICKIVLNSDSRYQQLLKGPPQTRGMRSGRVFLAPGESCGLHSTKAHEEMLIFLRGKGRALVGPDKEALEVEENAIVYIPPHTEHDILNVAEEPLVYIYCVCPV